ncbi:MAG TPA: Ig-like domain-containing protein, partial [Candidatus Methanoperedens sp.]
NTIVLLFGAQKVSGDTFNIGLANPINKADPNLGLDMSLGISYGFQGGSQYSQVDVNGNRLTTSAGGQDDGTDENGALITVGGIGDTNFNPADPFALPSVCGKAPGCDDELYSLLPFVNTSDTKITVFTKNPSNDDNILFAALNLKSVAAVVGEGIVLSPTTATNPVGTTHTVTATVQDATGKPIVGREVTFTILSGPNAPKTGNSTTDSNGTATFTYTSNGIAGTDTIQASFIDDQQKTITSNKVEKIWESEGPTPGPTTPGPTIPEFPSIIIPATGIMALVLLLSRRKEE